MKEITKDLRMELKEHFGSVAQIENVAYSRTDSDYWINKLKGATWHIEKGEKNFLDLVLSQYIQLEVHVDSAIAIAQALVKVKRKSKKETNYSKKYDDMHTSLNDYEYMINPENYKEQLDKLLESPYSSGREIVSKKAIFDVTTKGQEAVPECSECGGLGVIPCEKCGGWILKDIFGFKKVFTAEDFHYGTGKIVCKKCGGSGHLHCTSCDNGRVICSNCGGEGSTICSNCNGVGTITYYAGNYADGSEKIKSKDCPICNGAGKLTCSVCHGEGDSICPVCGGTPDSVCPKCNGEGNLECPACHGVGKIECPKCHGLGKKKKTDCIQFVKSFVDSYSIEKNVDVYIFPENKNEEPEVAISSNNLSTPIIISDWFTPYNLSQMFDQKGQIVVDNTETIAKDVCDASETLKNFINKIRRYIVRDKTNTDETQRNVCSIEKYYRLENVVTLTFMYNIDDYNEEFVLFIYDGNVWSQSGFQYVSFTEKMKIIIKTKLKGLFKK